MIYFLRILDKNQTESRSRKIKFKQFNFDYAKTKIQYENQHLQPGNFW